MGKFFRFSVLLGIAAAAMVLWLVASPLMFNAWARLMWQQIPCNQTDPPGMFSYRVAQKKYLSTHETFWVTHYSTHPVNADTPDLPTNSTCWVNPADPESAVLRLDSTPTLASSGGRFVGAALVVTVAAFLILFSPKEPARAAQQGPTITFDTNDGKNP